jgi:hypothetical protein
MAYHTVEEHEPHVYHIHKKCPDGKNIKKGNRRKGKGTDRRLCDKCAEISAKKL